MNAAGNSDLVRFGPFEADLNRRELRKHNRRIQLAGQPFEVLIALLEASGDVVTREALRNRLWPEASFGDFDHGLNVAIKKLRDRLGDSTASPRYIATVDRQGYQFIAEAARVQPHGEPDHSISSGAAAVRLIEAFDRSPAANITRTFPLARPLLVGFVAAAIGILGAIGWKSFGSTPTHVHQLVQMTHSGVVHPNQNLMTDGPRLYFSERQDGAWAPQWMLASGGRSTASPLPFARFDHQDISPDGAEFLVRDLTDYPVGPAPLWIVSVSGAMRRVGGVNATAAMFAADGRSIVFAAGAAVFICDKDGINTRQVLSLQKEVYDLHVSPRGDRISVSTEDPTSQGTALLEASVDGTGLRDLVRDSVDLHPDRGGSWTGDGRWFAFSGSHNGAHNIWLVDERSHALYQLTSGPLDYRHPTFSRDGKRLFCIGVSRRGELLRWDPATREFRPMLSGLSAEYLQYSPDGRSMAYVTYPDGLLWRARADGTERVQLTGAPWRATGAFWSPDSSRILFEAQTTPDGAWGWYVVEASGHSPRRLVNGTHHEGATWSRDGTSIIVGRSGEHDPLQVVDLEHGSIADLPATEGLRYPIRSPSGQYLLATDFKNWTLQLLDLNARTARPLARGIAYASWSADEQFVYFNRFETSRPTMSRLRVSDGKVEDLFTLGEFVAAGSWGFWSSVTPGGDVLMMRDTGGVDVYSIELGDR